MGTLTRTDLLKLIKRLGAFLGLSAILGPVIAFFYPTDLQETPSEPIQVAGLDSLPVGESKTVRFGRYPALVIHTSGGLRAYSAVCTHFACIVKWDAGLGEIVCPCHEGYFDPQDGSVLAGPPPQPLTPLAVYVQDGQIFVGGSA